MFDPSGGSFYDQPFPHELRRDADRTIAIAGACSTWATRRARRRGRCSSASPATSGAACRPAAAATLVDVLTREQVDRSMGDVHPYGNPHYLTDPMNGLRVAAAIRDRLSRLVRERAAAFAERYETFRATVGTRLVGEALVRNYGEWETLVQLADLGKLGR